METITFMNPETAKYIEDLETKVYRLERSRLIRRFIFRWVVIIGLLSLLLYSSVRFMNNFEVYSNTARYQLMNGVERGDAEDIARFNDYIEKDVYLFNGPITIKAMADKYNLDAEQLSNEFEESGYDELQTFFNKVIKDRVGA